MSDDRRCLVSVWFGAWVCFDLSAWDIEGFDNDGSLGLVVHDLTFVSRCFAESYTNGLFLHSLSRSPSTEHFLAGQSSCTARYSMSLRGGKASSPRPKMVAIAIPSSRPIRWYGSLRPDLSVLRPWAKQSR